MSQNRFAEDRCQPKLGLLCRLWKIVVDRPETGDPCVVFPGHILNKPDPCIYSQFLLMQLDQPVTWDNPDVRIFRNGVEQDTYNLLADTEYDIQIEVHNSSRIKPANETLVYVRWVEFGAGGKTKHPITNRIADVPVWPGTDTVTLTWRTPATPGHYCIEVELVHPEDGNPANNIGWNNTQVYAANSPVSRNIRIFNQYPNGCPEIIEGGGPYLRPHRILTGWGVLGAVTGWLIADLRPDLGIEISARYLVFTVIGYLALVLLGLVLESLYIWTKRQSRRRDDDVRPPRRIPCNLVELTVDSYVFVDEVGKDFDPVERFQGRAPEWPAHLEPSTFMFAEGEVYRDVELIVDAPDELGSPAVFNVNARQGAVASGGVTITITRGGD